MRLFRPAGLVLALLSMPACGKCPGSGSCTYASLLLLVHDQAAGDLLPAATVSEGRTTFPTGLAPALCSAGQCTHAVSPGTGLVTISLQGYQDAGIDFVQRADDCGYVFRQFFDVGMVPTTSAMPPVVTGPEDRGSGCK